MPILFLQTILHPKQSVIGKRTTFTARRFDGCGLLNRLLQPHMRRRLDLAHPRHPDAEHVPDLLEVQLLDIIRLHHLRLAPRQNVPVDRELPSR